MDQINKIIDNDGQILDATLYREQARTELLRNRSNGDIGFQDEYGYVIDYDKEEKPTTLGEGTLHTAIAIIAITTGNYKQDTWEITEANYKILGLLNTLLQNSWGNRDIYDHPIRHQALYEYSANGQQLRASPLTKDSFGAIIAAAYYAYKCPNSNSEIRIKSRELINKWGEYLTRSQWRTHYNYIPGEFEYEVIDGEKKYKNIYSKDGGRVMYKGPEAFRLMPHEIYAVKNVANLMGIPTVHWAIWSNGMPSDLKQVMLDVVAPYIAETATKGFRYILKHLNYEIPYSIPLGPSNWKLGKVEGIYKVDVDSIGIGNSFHRLLLKLIREIISLDNYNSSQASDLLKTAVNQISELLEAFSANLSRESWNSVLTVGLQRVIPWLDGSS
ncbi:hypothetical protein [Priestia sp. YIM B13490]|uniref:hypothetical protein n=1 Tax=Priestia sp. YIM B13490 TaxID=3366310 RepID=UPI003670F825